MSEMLSEPSLDLRQIAEQEMGDGGLFVYDREKLGQKAEELMHLETPFGLNIRYAAKANSHPEIIALFNAKGLDFDASSANEADKLLRYGVDGESISLSSQVLKDNRQLMDLLEGGVLPVATSLRQIQLLGSYGLRQIAVRINPGIGSGHSNRTNVGGPASSFGIWHEYTEEALSASGKRGMSINRLHTHIGSGADPSVWREVIRKSLAIAECLPEVTTLDVGGGYKIARMPEEEPTNMHKVMEVFSDELVRFHHETGRALKLEIEPGTYAVGNAGTLMGRVEEIVDTGKDGFNFLKLNVGMNAIMRPSLYGAQHPIEVLNDSSEKQEYVVVGPCCESGDILTPAPGNPEEIQPRLLNKAEIGDIVAIGGSGAYCASMSAIHYNDVPEFTEIVV